MPTRSPSPVPTRTPTPAPTFPQPTTFYCHNAGTAADPADPDAYDPNPDNDTPDDTNDNAAANDEEDDTYTPPPTPPPPPTPLPLTDYADIWVVGSAADCRRTRVQLAGYIAFPSAVFECRVQ